MIETLDTKNDRIWPFEKWAKIKFKEGLKQGRIGGKDQVELDL